MQRLVHGAGVRERAEIAPRQVARPSIRRQARELVRGGEPDVREALVVLEHDVVARLVRLDEVVLEQQRLGLRARHGHFHGSDLRDQHLDLRIQVARVEIAADAIAQVRGLADVEQFAVGREHAIDAGPSRQRRDEGACRRTSGASSAASARARQRRAQHAPRCLEHRVGEAPRLRVVAAAVIRIDQRQPLPERIFGAVGELHRGAPQRHCIQHGIVGEPAERHDHAQRAERGDFALQVGIAGARLGRGRLVGGRQALHGVRDAHAVQSQWVIGRDRVRLRTCEGRAHAACDTAACRRDPPVKGRPVRLAPCMPGAEADDQQARSPRIAEGRRCPATHGRRIL